jgi:UDPglucose 6-dehydrogenase
MNDREPIGIVGLGWVGLVTAACFAELGHRVIGREILAEKVEALRSGSLPFHEPGLAELIDRNRDRLEFTAELGPLRAARLAFVCVGTPPTHSGDADLTAVYAAAEQLAGDEGPALVMKSTVPVGTGRQINRRYPGTSYVSCPEFLREGTAVDDFIHPDRVVIGADPGDEAAAEAVAAIYEPIDAPVVRTDVASAEMVKLASNAFLATKISFINEIANVCEEVGADVTEVARGMGMDDRIGPKFLRAGAGYSGSCLPKDVTGLKQLAGNSGYHFQLLTSVIEVNELQKRRLVGKLEKHLGSLVGKEIALLGLAFKPDTDDMREAASLVLAARLQSEGATVRGYDPVAEEKARELLPAVEMSVTAMDALVGADAAVLVTEWQEFEKLDWASAAERMRTPLIVDGRNFLDPETLRAAGFTYEAIGRPETNGEGAAGS